MHLVGILFPHIIDDARSKPHQISLLYLITQKQVNLGSQCTATKMRGVSFFAENFVRKMFRRGKYLSCPDPLWGPSSRLFNEYRDKDKAAGA